MLRARYRRILWYFARVLLHLGWWDILLPRLGLRGLSERTRAQRLRQIAASFRTMAVQMGGVMIKVGQFLSSRLDVLPREITDELAGLQDEVRAETFEDIRAALESEFGARLEEKYVSFDPNPLASASIGQVHRAQMRAPAGEDPTQNDLIDVVVKVQRPNIEAIVEVDLSALRVAVSYTHLTLPTN
jgi:predicted unusual protein kinase regulating ubiquinone biosynthesis (AarF/ABC1/UbiB family)